MAISELPPVPSRNDPNGFAESANNFLGALPQFRLDLLAQSEIVEEFANEAQASADVAILNAAQAIQSKNEAQFLAVVAQGAANYKGDYDPATTYAVGESVTFSGDFYYSKLDGNIGSTPVDGPFWAIRGDLSGGGSEAVITTPVSDNENYALAFVVAPTFGAKGIKVATTGGLFNPATNTAGLNISGNAATANFAEGADFAGQVYQSVLTSAGDHRLLLGNGNNSNAGVSNRATLFFRQSTGTIHGANITGNAGSVTNGVYNNGGTYAINISGNAATAGSANFAANAGNAAACSGNAASSTVAGRWATPRNIALSGAVSGSASIDGSGNVSIDTAFPQQPTPIASVQVFTSSGTFTVPAGISKIKVTVVGAGGQGAVADGGIGGAGGGGGGCAIGTYSVTPGAAYAVTVGTTSGATSSFGVLLSATGGSAGGAGGAATGGDINIGGSAGSVGSNYRVLAGETFTEVAVAGSGGASHLGGGGAPNSAGRSYGGGGGGSTGGPAPAGAAGVVIVEY